MRASKVIIIATALAAVVISLLALPVRQWFMEFESYVKSLGAIGPVVVIAVYVLCTVLFIPGSAVTIGAGTLFGLKTGFIVVVLGANLGALCSFLLARSFLREKVA
ncbi:MAG TPA: VTT domain-containing protein, partial [Candidatus Binatia bacterium]|nr:VTT domain-containing protein [Candidatus Binatia bacterium]